MNTYNLGDIIKIIELYKNSETLYWEKIKETTGLLLEEVDKDLLIILAHGKKETHDIRPISMHTGFKVEVVSTGNC
jgi:hypothetical protein